MKLFCKSKQKTISYSQFVQNTQINKESVSKFWLIEETVYFCMPYIFCISALYFLALPSLMKTPQHSWYYGIHGTKFLDAVQESQRALSKRLGIVADFGCRLYYNITQFYHSFYCRQIVVYSSLCRDETLSSVVGKN